MSCSYAIESIHLSCNYAYKDVEQDITLGGKYIYHWCDENMNTTRDFLTYNSVFWDADDYFFSRYPVVQKRLAQAGIRLALILNRIFDGDQTNIIPLQVQ
jgi:hypothetical protein